MKGGKGIDNGKATVRITWPSPATDWDMKVFADTDGDGTSEGETKVVGSSADGTTNVESTTIAGPDFKPGKYVVRVTNFAAVEPYDGTVTFNKTPKLGQSSRASRSGRSPAARRRAARSR